YRNVKGKLSDLVVEDRILACGDHNQIGCVGLTLGPVKGFCAVFILFHPDEFSVGEGLKLAVHGGENLRSRLIVWKFIAREPEMICGILTLRPDLPASSRVPGVGAVKCHSCLGNAE